MTLSVHVACVVLMGLNFMARALRIRLLLRSLECRIGLWDAIRLNAWGDAACVLTPMRLGGEPARVWGMVRAGAPTSAAIVALALETLTAWPVILTFALVIGVLYGASWYAEAVPSLMRAVSTGWPWVVALAVASIIAWLVARRLLRHPRFGKLRQGMRRARVYARRTSWPVLLLTVPLTLLDLLSRVLVLVVLAQTLPVPPPLGPTLVGSFILLYSQLVLPTPSGAGVVDLGFLHGAAGTMTAGQAPLLLWWRVYTNGLGLALGVMLGLHAWMIRGTRDGQLEDAVLQDSASSTG